MRKLLLVACGMSIGLAVIAQGPVKMSNALKNISVTKSYYTVDDPLNLVQSPNPFVASGGAKAVNEYIVGGTKYDLQSNSANQNRIYRWPDGNVAATWTMGALNPNFTDRGTGYNYFNGVAWGPSPTARVESVRSGWPSIARINDGEIIVTHNGSTGLTIAQRPARGSGTWIETTLLGPLATSNTTATLWPRMITSGANFNNIHIISTSDQATSPDPAATYMGLDLAIVYNRSQDGGVSWNMNNVVLWGMDSTVYKGFRGDAYAWADPRGDTLAFVVGDNWYDLFLMKSTNGGTTWNKTVIFQHPYPMFDEATTYVLDTPYVCEGGISVALDINGQAHVVFGLMRVLNDDLTDAATSYFPITDGMGYWNESMPTMTSVNIDTLYNNGNLVAWMLDLNNDQTINWVGTSTDMVGRYYQSLVSQPYLIVDDNGDLYLVFTMVMETLNNGTQHYRHVWARKSTDGGITWSNFTDLTAASTHDFDECVFPAQAGNTDDKLHVLTQIDYEPGLAVRGDLDAYDMNDIVYITIPKVEVGTTIGFEETGLIKTFSVFPNPSEGQTTLGISLYANAVADLSVTNVMGQSVLHLNLGNLSAGPQLVPVDLSRLSSGIYTLTVKAGNSRHSSKVVIQ